jgi:protein-tyrosine phosphatase
MLTATGALALGSLIAPLAGPATRAAAADDGDPGVPPDDPRLRFVDVEGAFNIRDVGGWTAHRNRAIKKGVFFRGSALGRVTDLGLTQLAPLNLVLDVNFLSNRELAIARPDRLPAGVTVLNAPVGDDPGNVTEPTAPDTSAPDAGVLTEFRGYITGPQALSSFGAAVHRIALLGGRPFYLHCNSGTYRTGWATAVLMTAIGVNRDQVDQEFELSNLTFGVKYAWKEYLDAAFDQIEQSYGSFQRYLGKGLRVDQRTVRRLECALLA